MEKALEPLVRIKPGFQRWKTIACQFSRGTPGEHKVFAPRARRRRKPEHPVVKSERSELPPKIYCNIYKGTATQCEVQEDLGDD